MLVSYMCVLYVVCCMYVCCICMLYAVCYMCVYGCMVYVVGGKNDARYFEGIHV